MDNNVSTDVSAASSSPDGGILGITKGEQPIHLESAKPSPSDHDDGMDCTSPYTPDDPKDPRSWPEWKKNVQILMVSFHSFSSTFMAAGIIPAFKTFSEQYDVPLPKASYLTSASVCIISNP